VTGTLALVLSVNPDLDFDGVVDLLGKTADRQVGMPENGRGGEDECAGRRFDQFPSYHYGEGVVDAYAAVMAALAKRA